MIKTLYAYTEEAQAKIDEFNKVCDNQDEDYLMNKVGINKEDCTIGEMALKILSFYCDIPIETWDIKVVDISEDDVKILKRLGDGIVKFNRED